MYFCILCSTYIYSRYLVSFFLCSFSSFFFFGSMYECSKSKYHVILFITGRDFSFEVQICIACVYERKNKEKGKRFSQIDWHWSRNSFVQNVTGSEMGGKWAAEYFILFLFVKKYHDSLILLMNNARYEILVYNSFCLIFCLHAASCYY